MKKLLILSFCLLFVLTSCSDIGRNENSIESNTNKTKNTETDHKVEDFSQAETELEDCENSQKSEDLFEQKIDLDHKIYNILSVIYAQDAELNENTPFDNDTTDAITEELENNKNIYSDLLNENTLILDQLNNDPDVNESLAKAQTEAETAANEKVKMHSKRVLPT